MSQNWCDWNFKGKCFVNVVGKLQFSVSSGNTELVTAKSRWLLHTFYSYLLLVRLLLVLHRLRAFENRVLKRIFGHTRGKVTGEWRKLHNEELHNLYSSTNTIRQIKARRMRWAGRVARIWEERKVNKVFVGKPEGKRQLGRPRHRWEYGIRTNLGESGVVWSGFDWLTIGAGGWRRWAFRFNATELDILCNKHLSVSSSSACYFQTQSYEAASQKYIQEYQVNFPQFALTKIQAFSSFLHNGVTHRWFCTSVLQLVTSGTGRWEVRVNLYSDYVTDTLTFNYNVYNKHNIQLCVAWLLGRPLLEVVSKTVCIQIWSRTYLTDPYPFYSIHFPSKLTLREMLSKMCFITTI
jgi:hypothetical protein